MIKLLLKHWIYEKCIDVFFNAVTLNFSIPVKCDGFINLCDDARNLFVNYHKKHCYGTQQEKESADNVVISIENYRRDYLLMGGTTQHRINDLESIVSMFKGYSGTRET